MIVALHERGILVPLPDAKKSGQDSKGVMAKETPAGSVSARGSTDERQGEYGEVVQERAVDVDSLCHLSRFIVPRGAVRTRLRRSDTSRP